MASPPASFRQVHRGAGSSQKIRFAVSVSVLISMGVVTLLAQKLLDIEASLLRVLIAIIVVFLGFFGYEWTLIHSNNLTRQKRAMFNEANILETYQPRARTYGHLFKPDPPTPVPTVRWQDNEKDPERTASERQRFSEARDAHYADMFNYVTRANKEYEAMEKVGKASGSQEQPPIVEDPIMIEFQEPSEDEEEEEF